MVDFKCSQEQFESIHEALDKTRSNSKSVKVDKQALTNLLIDHTHLVQHYEETVDWCKIYK